MKEHNFLRNQPKDNDNDESDDDKFDSGDEEE